jgi:PAS domain S-box-containing protein
LPAEAVLSESIINSLPGVFYLYDETGKFLIWNKNFETVSGYSAEEIANMHPLNFFDVSEQPLLEEKIANVFKTGNDFVEANLLTKNKEKIPHYFTGSILMFDNKPCLVGMGINISDRIRHESAIQESEEKYRYLFNNNPALIFIWDLENFRILEVNDMALQTYGYTRDELLQMTVLDLRPADDHHKIREFAANFLNSGSDSVKKMWRHLKKSGEMMYMDISSHRIDFKGRKAILSLAKDITGQVQAEATISKTEQRFRNTLDVLLEGVQIYDHHWNCLYVNDTVTKQGPYSKEEIYARTLPENYPGIEQTELFRIFESCITGNESRHIEYEFTFPDQSKKWFELSLQPIPEGLFILSIDITERKHTDEVIRNSEEKRRLIMNAALDAIITIDIHGLITFWNPNAENIFGWKENEVMGKILADIIIPERYRKFHNEGIKNYLKTGVGKALNKIMELSAIRRGGLEFPIELIIHTIKQGNEEFFCAFIRDITDRKKAQQELYERNEQLRQLTSHLQFVREEERTHIAREIHDELGQQLTALKMDIVSLKNKISTVTPEIIQKTEEMTEMVNASIRSIRKIITELRPGILDDLGLLAALEWQAKEFEQKTGIPCQFSTSLANDHFSTDINTAVFRIFQESLTNIARHSGASRVRASLEHTGAWLILEINDNGKGITDDRRSNKSSFGLLGMRERAKMLNGEFDIRPLAYGGTAVTLKIPFTL